MKNTFLSLSALLLFSFSIYSQDRGSREIQFRLGINSASFSTSEGNTGSVSGINVGALIDFYSSDRWSFKTGLVYDQKGFEKGFITDLNTGISYNTSFKSNYLTVPVMANWHFGSNRNWYLHFGAYLGSLLSANDTKFNTDAKPFFNSFDFGINYGIGYKFTISDKLKLALEYDEQDGITSASDKFTFSNGNKTNAKNSRGSFNVALIFPVN